ncbi:MAG TPA: protease pro-enzyme activation domain-containing protein [Candidatus Polarisedimenticolia bacterium]|nr:protease pro-enzyme activation domain-containing protein [Candidatus Polarisedimenticolia bacterium]
MATKFPSAVLAQETSAAQPTSRPLITQPIDEAQLSVLKGNTHPLARREFDVGTAPATLPMQRMLLVLKRSADQESSLRKLLDNQQDKASAHFHKWLTPTQFGQQFGPTENDIQLITSWLQSHGFQVGSTKGRAVLEFSGSASQVREAFHTTIHKYVVKGEQHWANDRDPQIPVALTPAVAGVLTLHDFLKKPTIHVGKEPAAAKIVPGKKPLVTFPAQNGQPITDALAPQDYAVIYNMNPVYSSGTTGSQIVIGVIGRSNLFNEGEDINDFRNDAFSIPSGGSFTTVLNGPDPGDLGGGEEAEATLDSTWSGAIAYGATVKLVVSATTNSTDGVDLSEVYIVENNFADVMTESFSSCELLATDAQLAFSNGLAEQAAAQGITYFVSAGDNGAEGCDDPSTPPATNPISVNLLASTPFTVAVGGTMFNESGLESKYWGSEPPVQESAISYIPEDVWNESSLSNGLWSGSGGASAGNIRAGGTTPGVIKPSWQAAVTGIPNDNVRDLPDVSLTAAGHDPYLLCLDGSCLPDSQGQISVYLISGTSASAPSFAGIMALVDQNQGRQGQADYTLYRLAAAESAYPTQCNGSNTTTPPATTCIFNDVTVGNNVVPGEVGTQYQANAGYDLTTGLGSVNVANLVSAWASAAFQPTTTTLKLNSAVTPITVPHGTSVNVSILVTPNSGTVMPKGGASLIATAGGASGGGSGLQGYTLVNGSITSTTDQLPGGTSYLVHAHYAGDGAFAPSDSTPAIAVTVTAESSTTTVSAFNLGVQGSPQIFGNSTLPFGTGVLVRADVLGGSTHGVPTGMVTFSDLCNGTACNLPGAIFNPVANPVSLNSQGNTSIGAGVINFDAGSHSISASYVGDPSFSSSSSAQPVSFTIQPGFSAVSGPTNVSVTGPGISGTTTVGIIASTGFTTAVSFTCTGLPAEAACSPTSAAGSGPNTIVNTSINVTTTAPHTTMLQPTQRPYYFATIFFSTIFIPAMFGGLPLAGVFFLAAPKRRRRSVLLGMMLLALLVSVPACGGGGGGSHHTQDPGTPAGTYMVTVTATAGSISQQGSFTLTVQ